MSSTVPERAAVAPDVELGEDVTIRQFTNLYGCRIGPHSRIGTFVEIQAGATVGANCKIQSHSFICEGVTIGDRVFVGHNVTFINDRYPRASTGDGTPKGPEDWTLERTVVEDGASIGSSATVMCGVTIGRNAVVGAGCLVVRDVPANAVVAGVPGRVLRYLPSNKEG